MTQQQDRINKLNILFKVIEVCGVTGAIKDELESDFSMKYGTSHRTFLEYVNTLIKGDKIRDEGKRLFKNAKQELPEGSEEGKKACE